MLLLHTADYVVFGIILLLSALVGPLQMWFDRRKLATSESYFGGDRSLHVIPTAASLFASFYSAIALVGIPAEIYKGGAEFCITTVSEIIGIIIAAVFFVPIIYRLRLISAFEYFEGRFQSKALRKVATSANMLMFIFYLSVATYAPCVAFSAVAPVPLEAAVFLTAGITMIYTVLGGIKAVVLVDLLQAIVMFGGVLAAIIIGFSKIDGGVAKTFEVARKGGRLDFFDFSADPRHTYNFWIMMVTPIFSRVALYSSNQATVQRYSALPTAKQAMWAVIALTPQILILRIMLFLLAILMYAYYDMKGCDPVTGGLLKSSNQLTTFYIAEIIQIPGLVGLWFSAIFSGALSTMSTGYNSVAACIWEDLLKHRIQHLLSPRGVSIVLKVLSFLVALITALFALVFPHIQGSAIQMSHATIQIIGTANIIAFFNGVLFPFINAIGSLFGMVFATLSFAALSFCRVYFQIPNYSRVSPPKIENCTQMLSDLIETGKHVNMTLPVTPANGTEVPPYSVLPDGFYQLLSVSYFLYPFFCLLLGVLVSVMVGILTGGLESAKNVEQRYLIVKNCFLKAWRDKNVAYKQGKTDEVMTTFEGD